jgi:hypothetical protein
MESIVKLKVCEACGALWYRAQGDNSACCGACELKLKDFPTVESRKRRGRPSRIERMFRTTEVEA